jgi:hypothetical protein
MGLTKAQLEALNDSSFPNNNAGAITPAILRNYNDEVILNTVNQDVYLTDSASFDSRIDNINFDSSSLVTTASFNQYTASNDTKVNNLNTISASYLAFTQSYYVDSASFNSRIDNVIAGTGFVGTASFNAYTASTNSEISAIETFTASVSTSVGLLQTFSSSQYKGDSSSFDSRLDSEEFKSTTFVTTASFNSYTSSNDTKVNNLTSATSSYALSASVAVVDLAQDGKINSLTALTASTAYTNVNNTFSGTQSFDNVVVNGTASIQFLNVVYQSSSVVYSSGSNIFGDNANEDTQKLEGRTIVTGSLEVTGSTKLGNTTITGSLLISGSEVVAGPVTASKLQINGITDLNGTLDVSNDATFRNDVYIQSSGNPKLRIRDTAGGGGSDGFDIGISTSSFVIKDDTHDFNFFEFDYDGSFEHVLKLRANKFELLSGSVSIEGGITASNDISTSGNIYAANLTGSGGTIDTGSFATTGSNNFIGNQTITGSVLISGSSTTDLTVIGQIYVSSSATGQTTQPRIIVSGSSGQTTILRNTINTNNGTNSAGLNPAAIFTGVVATGDEIGISVNAAGGGISGWSTGPAIYVNNDAGDTYPAVFGFQNKANYTDGRVAVLTPLSASAGITSSNAFINGELYSVTSASFDSRIDAIPTINTGSFATTGSNVFVGKETISGSIEMNLDSTIRFYQLTSSAGPQTSAIRFYTEPSASGNTRYLNIQAVPQVGSNVVAISDFPTNNHFTFFDLDSHTITNEATTVNIGNQLNRKGALQVANYDEANLQAVGPTVFQGVGTSSVAYEQFINAGNYDCVHIQSNLNAGTDFQDLPSDTFVLNTWLNIPTNTGNNPAPQFVRGLGVTGSAVFSELTGSLGAFSSSVDSRLDGLVINTSSFATTGSNALTGSQIISGSLTITGSVAGNVTALSVTSNTASIDFNLGSVFTLTIPSSSVTYITGSNLKPGQTANIILTQQSTTGSVRFEGSLFKFPSGSINTGSAVASAVDMVSVASVNSTILYAVTANRLI